MGNAADAISASMYRSRLSGRPEFAILPKSHIVNKFASRLVEPTNKRRPARCSAATSSSMSIVISEVIVSRSGEVSYAAPARRMLTSLCLL